MVHESQIGIYDSQLECLRLVSEVTLQFLSCEMDSGVSVVKLFNFSLQKYMNHVFFVVDTASSVLLC